jgi:hypothetical protein
VPTYPIDLPSSPAPKTIRYRPVAINSMSRSEFSGEQQTYTFGPGWWEADILLPPMENYDARVWSAALQSLNGVQGTFYLKDPVHPAATHAANILSGPTIYHPSGVGNYWFGNSVILEGWTPGQPALEYGDWFTIASVGGLYRCQVAATADGSGRALVEFWPTLRQKAFHGAAVTVTNAKGPFRLDANNAASWQWDEGQLEMGMSFQAIEAF